MFTEETAAPDPASVTASPSLACDLSWLLSVAARPSMQARYPQLAEMFNGREDLADRVRGFWGEGSEETCFTEMQILAHHAGALAETDPDALWQAIESAVATVPLDLDMPSEDPAERETYLDRFRQLRESPELVRVVPRPPEGGLGAGRRHVAAGAARHRGGRASCRRAVRTWAVTGGTYTRWGVTSSGIGCRPSSRAWSRGNWSCSSCPACSSVRACTSSSRASS